MGSKTINNLQLVGQLSEIAKMNLINNRFLLINAIFIIVGCTKSSKWTTTLHLFGQLNVKSLTFSLQLVDIWGKDKPIVDLIQSIELIPFISKILSFGLKLTKFNQHLWMNFYFLGCGLLAYLQWVTWNHLAMAIKWCQWWLLLKLDPNIWGDNKCRNLTLLKSNNVIFEAIRWDFLKILLLSIF